MNPGPLARIEHPPSTGLAGISGGWSLHELLSLGDVLVKTGFLPDTIKTPQQVAAIVLKGSELRIPPMYALSNIVVVKSKPTCSAELMLALLYRDHGDAALIVEETTAELCRVSYRRRGWDRARAYAFTIADAATAQLTGQDTWKKYPAAMLRARCISAVARMAFPDSIAGMYLPEELGAEVRVTDDGAIEVASVPPVTGAPLPADAAAAERARAFAAEMDAAVAEADAPAAAVEPVTDETRLACAVFVDEVHAANPKYKPKLPPDAAGDAAWRTWLEQKRAAWQLSELNPAAVKTTA